MNAVENTEVFDSGKPLHATAYVGICRGMSDPFFFGYGSLVNRSTHAYPRATRATVTGWARAWKKSKLRRVAFLTAVEAHGEDIDGLIAAVPGADWIALDERERAYHRLPVDEIRHDHPPLPDIQIYRARPDHIEEDVGEHVMLLSYIDVVVQGYLREFGAEGADRFFATTHGWDMPICDDRIEPVYPRHQALTQEERAFVDDRLRRLDVNLTDRRP